MLAVPAALFLAVFFAYPVGKLLALSFRDSGEFSLQNFRWLFENPAYMRVLARTFWVAAAVTAICVLLAYPYAYLMTLAGKYWRVVLLLCVLIPFWTSLMVRNFAWLVILGSNGPLDSITGWLGLGRPAFLGSATGVMIAMAQILLPFMVLPLYATLRGIDTSLLAAAASLGARPSIAFFRVYLPLSIPGVMAGSLLVFVLSLGFYLTPAIIGSPQNSLLSQLMVIQIDRLLAWGHAGALAFILMIITVALITLAALVGSQSTALKHTTDS